jgi:O-methyltransferase involved in polyketide biosynthesis
VVDVNKPSVARMYDYYLGGKDNFAVDREAAERVLQLVPEVREVSLVNRRFLRDAVRSMAEAGIRQFIDLGTGIPTAPNVHETARGVQPDAVVVYVDSDPVVRAHNRALLEHDAGVVTVGHDLRDPAAVLGDPQVRSLIDPAQPVGILLIAVAHFIDLVLAPKVVARYVQDAARGSRVAITAASNDGIDESVQRSVEAIYQSTTAPFVYRTRAQFEELFGSLELLPPGVTELLRTPSLCGLGAVAVKR